MHVYCMCIMPELINLMNEWMNELALQLFLSLKLMSYCFFIVFEKSILTQIIIWSNDCFRQIRGTIFCTIRWVLYAISQNTVFIYFGGFSCNNPSGIVYFPYLAGKTGLVIVIFIWALVKKYSSWKVLLTFIYGRLAFTIRDWAHSPSSQSVVIKWTIMPQLMSSKLT